jgi:hypothetical protein
MSKRVVIKVTRDLFFIGQRDQALCNSANSFGAYMKLQFQYGVGGLDQVSSVEDNTNGPRLANDAWRGAPAGGAIEVPDTYRS